MIVPSPQREHVVTLVNMPNGVLSQTAPCRCPALRAFHPDVPGRFHARNTGGRYHARELDGRVVPDAASAKSMVSVLRSSPRTGPAVVRWRPKTVSPKNASKMPPKGSNPPKSGDHPPSALAWPFLPYRSYLLRFSGSESTSYASFISLNLASASVSPGLTSGWYLRARFQYAFFISASSASRSTPEPRNSHGEVNYTASFSRFTNRAG